MTGSIPRGSSLLTRKVGQKGKRERKCSADDEGRRTSRRGMREGEGQHSEGKS